MIIEGSDVPFAVYCIIFGRVGSHHAAVLLLFYILDFYYQDMYIIILQIIVFCAHQLPT